MPSFGEKLKQERLKRSITLEQIALSTKIGTRMLQALEDDRFNQLPGGIFNKGFVRAYARYVGLDEDQTVADYLEASGEAPPNAEPEVEPQPVLVEAPASPSRPLPWGLFAALLLVIALALSLWSRRQHLPERRPASTPPIQSPSVSSNSAPSQPSTPPGGSAATTEPTPAPKAEITPIPVSASSPAGAKTGGQAAEKSGTESAAFPPSPGPQPGEFTVVVLAREDSWLSITADGKSTFSDTLVAGNQRAIHARSQIVLRIGNAGGLDFVFNGKKLPPQGDYGEVRTLTFAAGGLQASSPSPSATPVVQ
ncbi:MAG TPA: RodZ domain-containing protein [Terriglobales bacterium]|nr:RodZ domain-containing protein [Terriglobales bacterium]